MSTVTQILDLARLLWQRGLVSGFDGNLSVREPDGSVWITRSSCHKGVLTAEDLVRVDADGHILQGTGRPSTELALHLALYAARPDVHAVVHAHPANAITCTLVGRILDQPVLPELHLALGPVPTVPYATTGTQVLARAVASVMRQHDAVLLDRHGAVTVGPDPLTAVARMEMLEHAAGILLRAAQHGGFQRLDGHEVRRLDAIRRGERVT